MNKKKRILVVSQHFWPESFRINDIADFFVENQNAHQITPFAEDGDDELQMVPEQRPPLRRKLFDEER